MSKLMKLKGIFSYRISNDTENQMTCILSNHENLDDVKNAREKRHIDIVKTLTEHRIAIIFAFIAIFSFGISLLAIIEGNIFNFNWISFLI